MATHASRDTTTGLLFEQKVNIASTGRDISKHALYRYLTEKNIDWQEIISKKLLPDEAYIDEETKTVRIYEKKFQQTAGSADEKPQTCGFKILQFRKLFAPLGFTDVTYTYIFNDWFKQSMYKDMLDYIKSVDGCDYFFA